jgi:hypothetical protein
MGLATALPVRGWMARDGHASCYIYGGMSKEPSASRRPRSTGAPGSKAAGTPVRASRARTVRASSTPSPQDASSTVSDEDIARRAYEIFLARNGEPGDPLEDWLQAERELTGKDA